MKLSAILFEFTYALNEAQLLDEAKEFSDKRDYDLMMRVFNDRVFPVLAQAGTPPTPETLAAVTDFPVTKVKAWLAANDKRQSLRAAAGGQGENMYSMYNNFRGSRDMHLRDAAKLVTYIVSAGRKSTGFSKGIPSLPRKQDILSHLGWSEDYLQDVLANAGDAVNAQAGRLLGLGKPVDIVAHAKSDNTHTVNKNKLSAWKSLSVAGKKQFIRSAINDIIKKDPAKAGDVTAEDIARTVYTPRSSLEKEFESLLRAINNHMDSKKNAKGEYVNKDMFDLHTLLRTERQTRPTRVA